MRPKILKILLAQLSLEETISLIWGIKLMKDLIKGLCMSSIRDPKLLKLKWFAFKLGFSGEGVV